MKDLHSISNCWETPQDLFDVLDKGGVYQGMHFEGFNFDIDLCADNENTYYKILPSVVLFYAKVVVVLLMLLN